MGLDISVYGQAVKTDFNPDDHGEDAWDVAYEEGLRMAYIASPEFEHALGGLEQDAWYKVGGDEGGFRAGSYSGYNLWRESLCKAVLGVEPETVWNNTEKFRDEPFFELIHFSDCEGVIGPETAQALYEDFQAHRDQFERVVKNRHDDRMSEHLIKTYDHFLGAFNIARNGGMVVFH